MGNVMMPWMLERATGKAPTTAMPQKKVKRDGISTKVEKKPLTRKKKTFTPTLYINSVAYEFGVECGYCAAGPAVVHCPSCPEFLCEDCNNKIHSHKKHQHHVRSKLPKYDLGTAAHCIIGFFRYLQARETLRALCRQRFRCFYDPSSRTFYYFDIRTRTAQWNKPYCMRNVDLRPPLSVLEAVRRLQNFCRYCIARRSMRDLTHTMFERIYDPVQRRCFYYYKGDATYVAKVRWERPPFLYKSGDDIQVKLTDQIAAMRIQYHWRKFLVRRLLRRLVRRDFRRVLDPTTGSYCYWLPDGEYLQRTPYLLGSERWESENMELWSIDEIKKFFRRIGLKEYLKSIDNFEVDGALLLACEDADFQLLGITSKFHIKSIRTAIKHTHRPGEDSVGTSVWARRKELRRLYENNRAATLIQRNARAYIGKRRYREMKTRLAAVLSRQRVEKDVVPHGLWYTRMLPQYVPEAIKTFGKRKPQHGANGWGIWSKNGWESVLQEQQSDLDHLEPDGHESLFWLNKMQASAER